MSFRDQIAFLLLLAIVTALFVLFASIAHARDRNVPAEFQRIYPCPSTGKATGACPTHVRDHVIPLACGGPDSIVNLVWQTVEEGKAKDRWERECWRWTQP